MASIHPIYSINSFDNWDRKCQYIENEFWSNSLSKLRFTEYANLIANELVSTPTRYTLFAVSRDLQLEIETPRDCLGKFFYPDIRHAIFSAVANKFELHVVYRHDGYCYLIDGRIPNTCSRYRR